MHKELLSTLAIVLTLVAYLPYIRDIRRGKVRPHIFSWIIWGSTTIIVFFAQLADRGGAGAWPTGVSGAITVYVAWLAWTRKADSHITRTDWLFFITAMSALPLWYFSENPLWAVVVLTAIDTLGFAPTFRKSWQNPFGEQLTFFILMAAKYLVSLLALEHHSMTTILFPATLTISCMVFIAMVMWRRRVLS